MDILKKLVNVDRLMSQGDIALASDLIDKMILDLRPLIKENAELKQKLFSSFSAPHGFAFIPVDTRYSQHEPKITNDMKAVCNGEFEFTIDEPCPKCALHLEDHYDDVECLCGGSDDRSYQKNVSVPWDVTKDIYKGMATVAMQEINKTPVNSAPVWGSSDCSLRLNDFNNDSPCWLNSLREFLDVNNYRLIMFGNMWSLWKDSSIIGEEGFNTIVHAGKTLSDLKSYMMFGDKIPVDDAVVSKDSLSFTDGIMVAAGMLFMTHGQPTMAGDIIRQHGLVGYDCSNLDDFDKAALATLSESEDLNLKGVHSAESNQQGGC